jgi:hypothetical protein
MRIVVFVGSPLENDEADLVKLAKRLKKEKVNCDIVSFGDHPANNDLLNAFINVLNGKDGTGSHLVSVPRGSALSEALLSSPIIQGEDGLGGAGLGGASFEFGVDPNEDPELALVRDKAETCVLENKYFHLFFQYSRLFVCPWKNNVIVKKPNNDGPRPIRRQTPPKH